MPVSNYNPTQKTGLAIAAESLYLVNLLLLPGLAFALLLLLYLRERNRVSPFTLSHLQQTISASIWAGILLFLMSLLIVLLGGVDGPYTWVIVIVYFTMAHSTFILLGMVGLIKALAGQCWKFPLIGRPLPEDC
ncbi:MAG: hypothetical protein ISR73_13235 [Gammaproteobacteria bacterium]|nr:hypothetical protein [Gammaproteobacteria bacterium]